MKPATYQQFKELIDNKNYGDAEKFLLRQIKNKPKDSNARFELAKLLLNNPDRKDEAVSMLEDLLDTKKRKRAMLELGRISRRENNIQLASYYFNGLLTSKYRGESLIELGKMYKATGDYETAKSYFKMGLDDKEKLEDDFQKEKFKIVSLMQLTYIEIHCHNYKDAYMYLYKMLEEDSVRKFCAAKDLSQMNLYLKYKLGILTPVNLKNNSYFFKQLQSYDKNYAVQHIKSHFDEDLSKREHSAFLNNINIEDLFRKAGITISHFNPYSFALCDKYIVKYNFNVGIINDILTNKVKVIALPNTNNILTMYPVISDYGIECLNEEIMPTKKLKLQKLKLVESN